MALIAPAENYEIVAEEAMAAAKALLLNRPAPGAAAKPRRNERMANLPRDNAAGRSAVAR
ncbi:hypothetical protein ACFRAU_15265 [Arthrobacter sp. NPDC056691]|uniref:hypothetical protein n=1 Tax=Arthrobacter sp. NPDC056691 TaxID=3345913 RepID=UPI003672F5D2